MSKPEPKPLNKGAIVPDALMAWLQRFEGSDEAIKLIKDRDEFGRKKYGQPLRTGDGRNTEEDALQELGDLLQYCYKAKLNGSGLEKVKRILPFLVKLLQE